MASLMQRLFGRQEVPKMTPMKEMGARGVAVWGGRIRTIDKSSAWAGQQRYITASDIVANVSIVAASAHYFLNVVSRPTWKVVPASDKPEASEYAEYVQEVIEGLVTPWPRVIRKATTYRFHGFSLSEWTASKRDDGRIGMLDIEGRPQHTIDEWTLDESGKITGVWQRSPQTSQLLGLPRGKLIYMVDDSLTDSPEGLGAFRHMAEPYDRLKQFLTLETRAFERDLRGTPIGRAPISLINEAIAKGAMTKAEGDALIAGMQSFVELQVKESDTGMMLDSMPYESEAADGRKIAGVPQWDMQLLQGSATGLTELHAAIDRVQREMARVLGTEHLMLGESAGSRALSQDKSRNLYLSANAVLEDMVSTFTQDLIDPIWSLNSFPDEYKPWFQAEDVTPQDVEQVTSALREMATAGAVLAPDDPVIDDVRDLLGISRQPERSDAEMDAMVGASMGGGEEEEAEADEKKQEELDKLLRTIKGYNPAQQREPRGTPIGGRWADDDTLTIGGQRLTMWHGTADDVIDSIMEHGLLPKGGQRIPEGADAWLAREDPFMAAMMTIGGVNHPTRPHSVFLTASPDDAARFAEYAAQARPGSRAVVLQVRVPKNAVTRDEFVGSVEAFRHVGKIEPTWISRYDTGAAVKAGSDTLLYLVIHANEAVVKFDPNQPRHPKGDPRGGQWSPAGGGGATDDKANPQPEHRVDHKEGDATQLLAENWEVATEQDILDELDPEIRARIEAVEEELANGVPTIGPVSEGGFVNPDGTWTAEREALHAGILEKFFNPTDVANATPAEGEKPSFVFLGGRPGAGKTSSLKSGALTLDPSKYLTVAADEFQELLPGYKPHLAGLFNQEGQYIAERAERMARTHGLNIILDATMKSTVPAATRVTELKAAGYQVAAYFTHTTPQTSARRSISRFMSQGRYVPMGVSLRSLTNEQTFDVVRPHLDAWALFDNNGTKPRLVAKYPQ